MLLKIKRLEEDGKIAFNVDLEFGMTFNYLLNVSFPDR